MKGERWMDAINFHVIVYLFTRQEQTKNKKYAPDQPNMKSRISMCTLTQWEKQEKTKENARESNLGKYEYNNNINTQERKGQYHKPQKLLWSVGLCILYMRYVMLIQ